MRARRDIALEIENRLAGNRYLLSLSASVAKWSEIIMKNLDGTKLLAERHPTGSISPDEEIADGVIVNRVDYRNLPVSKTVKKSSWDS